MIRADRFAVWFEGPEAERQAMAYAAENLDTSLWVGKPPESWAGRQARFADLRRELGATFGIVILDLRTGAQLNAIGAAHGLVHRGGALVFLANRQPSIDPRLLVYPAQGASLTSLAFERIRDRFFAPPPTQPLARLVFSAAGSEEQTRLVPKIVEHLQHKSEAHVGLLHAPRGRGKSAALGLAISRLEEEQHSSLVLAAANPKDVAPVLKFAPDRLRIVHPEALALGHEVASAIIVDEAARLSVALLRRITGENPSARVVLSTTVDGYEGTGRGVLLRLKPWLRERRRLGPEWTLRAPIRWDEGDSLEDAVDEALLLRARAPEIQAGVCETNHEIYTGVKFAEDEQTLREVFGLLVEAHYRTTPDDLARLLDGPNLRVHLLRAGATVVAANLIAIEGELPKVLAEELYWGRQRIRGHALPDTLISHAGELEAAGLKMIRSVRIATHPEARRQGHARRLLECVHETYSPDLFGTLFGLTPSLLSFRRSLGYELVRLGLAQNARSGEPSVVMAKPVSEQGVALLSRLRAKMARDLPAQLEMMDAARWFSSELRRSLLDGLPEPAAVSSQERFQEVAAYAFGQRPLECSPVLLAEYLNSLSNWGSVSEKEKTLLMRRVLQRLPWMECASDFESVPAAMRACRRAFREVASQDKRVPKPVR